MSQALLSPTLLKAQALRPQPDRPHKRDAATEVEAQRFVLVDASGLVQGEFKLEDGEPEIVLYDKDGKAVWRATTHQRGLQPVLSKP